jgi:hypothetical protein
MVPGMKASGRRMQGVNDWFEELSKRATLKH